MGMVDWARLYQLVGDLVKDLKEMEKSTAITLGDSWPAAQALIDEYEMTKP